MNLPFIYLANNLEIVQCTISINETVRSRS